MKKLSIYLLPLALLFSFISSQTVHAESTFKDVDNYGTYINYLYDNDIIQGYDGGTFKPHDDLKRLQGVQMILNALDIPLGDAPNPGFTDVQPGDYGYDYIAKAAQLDIINGYPDGSFGTWNTLMRGQMASILDNAFDLDGYLTYSFKDVLDYLVPAVAALRANGITAGYPNHTFGSFKDISREHFSIFLAKTLKDSLRSEPDLQANFLDVGQGDSALIIFPNQTTMLVDAGEYGDNVVSDLKNAGISHIDTLVATHPDSDHIGGLDEVINNFSIGKFVDSGQASDTQTYNELHALLDRQSIPVVTVNIGDDISTDNNVSVTVLNNDSTAVSSDKNDASLVLKVSLEEQDVLLTGDISSEEEQYLLDEYDLEAEILKVAHHGSKYSTSPSFLSEVEADAAILSYGDNSYGHPSSEVINRLNAIDSDIFATKLLGDIQFNISDDQNNPYWVNVSPSFVEEPTPQEPDTDTETQFPINVNTADYETLQLIKGVGPAIAGYIIDYRNANGPFQSINELDNVKYIGPATLDEMRPYITL